MHKPKTRYVPVTLEGLREKLGFEIKRLVREREEGIVKHVSTTAILNGTSTLVFKNKDGEKITLSYRLDKGGALRFAREKQFAPNALSPLQKSLRGVTVGRASGDIMS